MLVRKSAGAHSGALEHESPVPGPCFAESILQDVVTTLSVPRHFSRESDNNRRVGEWIADQLRLDGYRVRWQGESRNVALPRRNSSKPLLLVGAHYDSVPGTPGADDNASGVAALLACAKTAAQISNDIATCFVAFNREEDGLIGSFEFVEHGISELGLNISEAHILEMIGYSSQEPGSQTLPKRLPITIPDAGNFLAVVGNRDSSHLIKRLLRQARSYSPAFHVIGLQIYLGLERYVPALWRSDHAPFWKARIPAVMWTDTAEFRNPNYHTPGDTPETLDYRFLGSVTQLLLSEILRTTAE